MQGHWDLDGQEKGLEGHCKLREEHGQGQNAWWLHGARRSNENFNWGNEVESTKSEILKAITTGLSFCLDVECEGDKRDRLSKLVCEEHSLSRCLVYAGVKAWRTLSCFLRTSTRALSLVTFKMIFHLYHFPIRFVAFKTTYSDIGMNKFSYIIWSMWQFT